MPDYPLTESVEASDATEQAEGDLTGSDLVEEEILVEEISIDGMCGVY
jgi:mycofactocin precursor